MNLSEGKCPQCKEVNEIFLEYANLPDELKEVFTVIKCIKCKTKIITSKVSDYVVCKNCKSTLIIEKEAINKPPGFEYMTDMEYFLLLAKLYSFNPYLMPFYSNYYLQPGFEKEAVQSHKTKFTFNEEEFKKRKMARAANDTYSHLIDVINKNEIDIKTKYIPSKKKDDYNNI